MRRSRTGQHLAVLTERKRRPWLRWRERILRVWLSRLWAVRPHHTTLALQIVWNLPNSLDTRGIGGFAASQEASQAGRPHHLPPWVADEAG